MAKTGLLIVECILLPIGKRLKTQSIKIQNIFLWSPSFIRERLVTNEQVSFNYRDISWGVSGETLLWYRDDSAYCSMLQTKGETANWRPGIGVHEASLCVLLPGFTCARNIVFQHKINFCVDVECTVCLAVLYLCIIEDHIYKYWVRMCSLGAYVVIEHMVNSKWFQISTWWTRKFPEHILAPICWEREHFLFSKDMDDLYNWSHLRFNKKFWQRSTAALE